MKQKIPMIGHRFRSDSVSFEGRPRTAIPAGSASVQPAASAQEPNVAPSDISGVRSSTFQALHQNFRRVGSIPTTPEGSINDWERSLKFGGGQDDLRGGDGNGPMYLTGGYRNVRQTHDVHSALAAAQQSDRRDPSLNRPFREGAFFFGRSYCSKKCSLALSLLFIGMFVPIAIISFFDVNENPSTMARTSRTASQIASKLLTTLVPKTKYSVGQSLWADHVVIETGNRLLISETFASRLNAEVAPLLEQHVDVLWDDAESPKLSCGKGEHLLVAFSVAKSGSLPAGIFYERPCTPYPSSRKCLQEKRIADVRDLMVRLPDKSSKHTYSVKVEEHRVSDGGKIPTPRRFIPFGTIEGPFQVELSDGCKLAIQRYCGRKRMNFAEDLDIELLTKDNTRLLTIYELKRLHSLWTRTRQRLTGKRGPSWGKLQLSRATIDPVEHSRHSISMRELSDALSKAHGATKSQFTPDTLEQQGTSLMQQQLGTESGHVETMHEPVAVSVPTEVAERRSSGDIVEVVSTVAAVTSTSDIVATSSREVDPTSHTAGFKESNTMGQEAQLQGGSANAVSEDESQRDDTENGESEEHNVGGDAGNDVVDVSEGVNSRTKQTGGSATDDASSASNNFVTVEPPPSPFPLTQQQVPSVVRPPGAASVPETSFETTRPSQPSLGMASWQPEIGKSSQPRDFDMHQNSGAGGMQQSPGDGMKQNLEAAGFSMQQNVGGVGIPSQPGMSRIPSGDEMQQKAEGYRMPSQQGIEQVASGSGMQHNSGGIGLLSRQGMQQAPLRAEIQQNAGGAGMRSQQGMQRIPSGAGMPSEQGMQRSTSNAEMLQTAGGAGMQQDGGGAGMQARLPQGQARMLQGQAGMPHGQHGLPLPGTEEGMLARQGDAGIAQTGVGAEMARRTSVVGVQSAAQPGKAGAQLSGMNSPPLSGARHPMAAGGRTRESYGRAGEVVSGLHGMGSLSEANDVLARGQAAALKLEATAVSAARLGRPSGGPPLARAHGPTHVVRVVRQHGGRLFPGA